MLLKLYKYYACINTHNKTKIFMKSQQNFNNLAIMLDIFFKIQGGKLKHFGKYSSRKLVSEWNLNCEWNTNLASFGIVRWAGFKSMVSLQTLYIVAI